MRRSVVLVLTAALLLNGCYSYRSLPSPQLDGGSRVRATMTYEASEELGGALGPGVASVEGNVVRSDTAGVTLAIRTVRLRGGDEQYWRGETYTLPRRSIAVLEERRLDRVRTGLAAGALVALWAGLFLSNRGSSGSTVPDRPGGPPR